jgi:hypothetical protein
MPTGCGTWPAFWTLGDGAEWPTAGEIDIIEGTNEDTYNTWSVHTGNGLNCTVPKDRKALEGMEFTGNEASLLCDGAMGCNVKDPGTKSFGAGLNGVRGGYYVTRRDARGVSFWYWPHNAGAIPESILDPGETLDESLLGHKIADIPTSGLCADLDNHLLAQRLIFNLTFCGGWGGDRFNNGACGKKLNMKCNAFVDEHPEAFKDAYWLINGVWVYVPQEPLTRTLLASTCMTASIGLYHSTHGLKAHSIHRMYWTLDKQSCCHLPAVCFCETRFTGIARTLDASRVVACGHSIVFLGTGPVVHEGEVHL